MWSIKPEAARKRSLQPGQSRVCFVGWNLRRESVPVADLEVSEKVYLFVMANLSLPSMEELHAEVAVVVFLVLIPLFRPMRHEGSPTLHHKPTLVAGDNHLGHSSGWIEVGASESMCSRW
jgi:hypothetical protein